MTDKNKQVYVVVGETFYEDFSILAVYDSEEEANNYVDELLKYASEHEHWDIYTEDEIDIIEFTLNGGTLTGFLDKTRDFTYAGKVVRKADVWCKDYSPARKL